MSVIHLVILSPSSKFFEGDVDMVTVPTKLGPIGVLPSHYPIISLLVIGTMHILIGTVIHYFAISGGIISVQEDRTLILAEAIECPQDIDVGRARAAKERAEALIVSKEPNIDLVRAQAALQRALNRIRVAEEHL